MSGLPQGPNGDRLGNRDLLMIGGGVLAAVAGFALLHRLVAWGLAALHAGLGLDVAPPLESSMMVSMFVAVLVVGPLSDRRGLWRKALALWVQVGMVVVAVLADLAGALLVGWSRPAQGGVVETTLWLAPLLLLPGLWLLVMVRIAARFDGPDGDAPE